jgi:hypothetical protein
MLVFGADIYMLRRESYVIVESTNSSAEWGRE